MAIVPYIKQDDDLLVSKEMLEAHTQGVTSRTLLTALGDYWTDYFGDIESLAASTTGATVLVSEAYNQLMDLVLASNLLDIPVEKPVTYQLLLFREEDFEAVLGTDGSVNYYAVEIDVESIDYLVSSLFEAEVVFTKGIHYTVVDNQLRFYVDIFNDDNIFNYAYSGGESTASKHILFWATSLVFRETWIHDRFGTYLYNEDYDSEEYRQICTALLFFYANTKSTKRIETIINALFGLPFARTPGEVVSRISYVDENMDPLPAPDEALLVRIDTNLNTYFTYPFTELLVSEGQELVDYELLSRFHKVDDYITDPDWYDGARFPSELFEGYTDQDFIEYCKTTPGLEGFAKLVPNKYGGAISYDDSFVHLGGEPPLSLWDGRDPFLDVKSKQDGRPFETKMYDLMDQVMKYNLVYIYAQLSWNTYDFYKDQQQELLGMIKTGFPVYLYPLVDVVFRAIFSDTFEIESDSNVHGVVKMDPDYGLGCQISRYNGVHTYGEEILKRYDEEFDYDSASEHRSEYLNLYNSVEKHNASHKYMQYNYGLFHRCEYNIQQISAGIHHKDTYEWKSPDNIHLTYSGAHGHNGRYEYLDIYPGTTDPSKYKSNVFLKDQIGPVGESFVLVGRRVNGDVIVYD